ncbi:MAG: glycosyltransferase [Fibrobacter sp.]|nr:glycosyltransferase [Fibrobacter sp.]
MQKKTIHFYSDSWEWGGQEILSARLASALAESNEYKVSFFYSCAKFKEALCPQIQAIQLPYSSSTPFPIFRDRSYSKKRICKQLFLENNVSFLVVCPGNIERCLPAIYVANELSLKIVSYLPMAYSQVESGSVLGHLRDFMALPIYPLINQWIVISDTQEKLLRRYISPQIPVYQIPNPLTWETLSAPKAPQTPLQIGTVGRINFGQKRQNIIPPLASAFLKENIPVKFNIIGNGTDVSKLEHLIRKYQVSSSILCEPWLSSNEIQERMNKNWNVLFIPSRFESGPMVLFEAFQCGIPVLIANAAYVSDYSLPGWMVYDGSVGDAFQKLKELPDKWDETVFLKTRENLLKDRYDAAFRRILTDVFKKVIQI